MSTLRKARHALHHIIVHPVYGLLRVAGLHRAAVAMHEADRYHAHGLDEVNLWPRAASSPAAPMSSVEVQELKLVYGASDSDLQAWGGLTFREAVAQVRERRTA